MRLVGLVRQPCPPCGSGTGGDGRAEAPPPATRAPHGAAGACETGPGDPPPREGGRWPAQRDGSPGAATPGRGEDNKLYIVFNVCDDESGCWTYQEGVLSVKVTRKGSVISTLDADWLELTTFYYKQGLSLIDSFLCWETPKGDHLPKSLEGFFIYEEGSGVLGSSRKGNDAIVVEQWTVIEGCEVKTDYGPLLHTLAECGWLLTSVLATPILRRDSEGNLATKQVVFLQRPVIWNSVAQTPERKAGRPAKGEDRSRLTSRSVGLDTAASQAPGTRPPEEGLAAPSRECWTEESPAHYSGFPGWGSSAGALRGLADAQLDQEDGAPQVTCM